MSAPTVPTLMFCTVHKLVSCALDDAIDRQECEFIDMQLVPLDALVLLRDEEGNWPQVPDRVPVIWGDGHKSHLSAYEVRCALDALAAASQEGQ